jgi:tetratricopeptide (TPR) repeat protein
MNKSGAIFSIICVFALLTTCASTGGGSGYGLYDAIEQSAEQIAGNLPAASRVAIVAFESEHDNVSDYIMEELTGALFDRNIEVADRQNLEYVYKELNFQMSGDVSDDEAKSIGKFLAADMVITGQMLNLDSMYRYRTNAINVETAVRASVTRLDVRADSATRRMVAAIANQQTTTKVAKYGVSADATPQTAGTFLDRGIMFASRGEYEMAIMDFDEAIRLNPNMSAAYALRARALHASVSTVLEIKGNFSALATFRQSGQQTTPEQRRVLERAVADFTQAIRLDPNNYEIYVERGIVYSDMDDYGRALADFEQALRLNNSAVYVSRGTTYAEMGDFEKAIADYTQAIRLEPNHFRMYSTRGQMYYKVDDFEKAIADFDQAIRLNPNVADAYMGRGLAYAYKDKADFDRAIADLTQALRLNPNIGILAYFARGYAYGMKRDYDRAIADWEAVLRINPNYPDVRGLIDTARQRRGR